MGQQWLVGGVGPGDHVLPRKALGARWDSC